MATTNTVEATKYGMQLTFHNSELDANTTKSYSGLNFSGEAASIRGAQLQQFLYGVNDTSGLTSVINAMDNSYSFLNGALTATNPVTFRTT